LCDRVGGFLKYAEDKFGIAGLQKMESRTVASPRLAQCQVQLEAFVEAMHGLAEDDINQHGRIVI
jgi:flavin reductase (DIM6/NTAB) family NADH-FMN oxidoreductase RutF